MTWTNQASPTEYVVEDYVISGYVDITYTVGSSSTNWTDSSNTSASWVDKNSSTTWTNQTPAVGSWT